MPALLESRQVKSGETSDAFTPEEANNLFDATARRYMGISGDEFLQRWDNGEFRDSESQARAMRVAILIPIVRKTSARKKSA